MMYRNIKKICDSKNISISQLERELGFSRGSLCKWDENKPSVTKAQKVANYLDVPIEQLLE